MHAQSLAKGRYRHFKGNFYQVLDIVHHSETQEPMVLYQALYGESGLWVRPLAMFTESVNHQGQVVLRFTWVGE